MRKSLYITCLLVTFLSAPQAASFGAVNDASQFFGPGSHALFAQQNQQAIAIFDRAEAQGVQDPRNFFLRGVAQLRLGNTAAATADIQRGAALEWALPHGNFNINQALTRIQGQERLMIEEARRVARANWEQVERQRRMDRYGEIVRDERAHVQAQIERKNDAAGAGGAAGMVRPPQVSPPLVALPFGARSIDPARRVATLTDPLFWSRPRQQENVDVAAAMRAAVEAQAREQQQAQQRQPVRPVAPAAFDFGALDDPFGDPFGGGSDDDFGFDFDGF